MARYDSTHKEQTHERLVSSAVRTFRRAGVDSAALNDIMRELGLTVGGFYRHFGSKADLVQAAVARGLEQSLERIRRTGKSGGPESVARFADIYLSDAHRRSLADGCVLAALGSDIARGDSQTKAVCERGLRAVHQELHERLSPADRPTADEIWSLIALEVGGLLLARMVESDTTASEILTSCRHTVRDLLAQATNAAPTAAARRRTRAGKRMPASRKRGPRKQATT